MSKNTSVRPKNPTPEFGKFGGYFNIDSGTGRARGMSVFGPPETAAVLREALTPFADLGFAGVLSTQGPGAWRDGQHVVQSGGLAGDSGASRIRSNTSTRPGTRISIRTRRIIENDVKASAIIFAAAVYTLAMRDETAAAFCRGSDAAIAPADTVAKWFDQLTLLVTDC